MPNWPDLSPLLFTTPTILSRVLVTYQLVVIREPLRRLAINTKLHSSKKPKKFSFRVFFDPENFFYLNYPEKQYLNLI